MERSTRFIPRKVQVIYSTPLNCKVRSRTQYLSLVLCLHLQSLTDCKVPLSQGPGYVWRWLLIVVISDRELIDNEIRVWARSKADGARDVELSSSVSNQTLMTGIKPTVSLFSVWQRELNRVPIGFSTLLIQISDPNLTLKSCTSIWVTFISRVHR